MKIKSFKYFKQDNTKYKETIRYQYCFFRQGQDD